MHRTWLYLLAIVIVLSVLGYVGYQYLQGTLPYLSDESSTTITVGTLEPISSPTNVPFTIEPFVQNLSVPWSMVFTSPERMLVTERPGRIRVVENGELAVTPLRTFTEVSSEAEEGLMGMTLDPAYADNRYLYICMAYGSGDNTQAKLVRLTDEGTTLTGDTIILDNIPAAEFHAGCRIAFGPDGKLYITTGDARDPDQAQEIGSLGGKVLRINSDGTVPNDNPFPSSPVFSYGHRNPQGIDWHPEKQTLVISEHGPSGNDGPGGGDEINLITAGSNYGWPVVSHQRSRAGMTDPLLLFTPAVAPASGMFYSGDVFPQLKNHYLIGLLRGEGILDVTFDESGTMIEKYEKVRGVAVGRVRDIIEGPDGLIYFSTSNTDGRGSPAAADDTIYRTAPTQ